MLPVNSVPTLHPYKKGSCYFGDNQLAKQQRPWSGFSKWGRGAPVQGLPSTVNTFRIFNSKMKMKWNDNNKSDTPKFGNHKDHLMFQRCIIIGLYYFSLKPVNNGKCITADTDRGSLGYGPWRDKTCLPGFRQSEFQTSILSYRD